jgi:DNA invertase Pin-like site-specific DNA recombinase
MRIVAYIRVSTDKQGRSGLGLEAQIAAIGAYAEQHGAEIIETYREVESGKKNDRPELARAMARAHKTKATLVIAKLDRLSRDAHFLLGLQKAGVPFVACDMPYADSFTIGIMAMVAQKEREMTSQRTKAAMAAAKARGARLGSPVAAQTARIATEAKSKKAATIASNIAPIIDSIERAGAKTLAEIAAALEARGIKTPRGGTTWQPIQVSRIKQRAA